MISLISLFLILLILSVGIQVALLFLCLKIFKVKKRSFKETLLMVLALFIWGLSFSFISFFSVEWLASIVSLVGLVIYFLLFNFLLKKFYSLKTKEVVRIIVSYYLSLTIITIILVVFVRLFVVVPFYTSGASMEPNFQSGEYLLIKKFNSTLERGDVVVFQDTITDNQHFFQRIVGLPGDKILISEGALFVNGQPLDEASYLSKDLKTLGEENLTLRDYEYYLLGDNRNKSYDSRKFGTVPESNIVGKIWFRTKMFQ